MDRREFLTAGAALAASLAAAAARAETHAGHDHAGDTKDAAAPADPKLAAIAKAATDCASTGAACIRHCVVELGKGDTALAGCLDEVLQTSAICEALAALARYTEKPTPRFVAYARACATYCRDCAAECKKHAEHHEACRVCMEACERCAEACEALPAPQAG